MNTKLKICGIRREEDISMVNEINPDYIGFVFAKSKRRIDLIQAVKLKEKLKPSIKSVGVFVNESITDIVKIVQSGAIDLIQLHGEEDKNYIEKLKDNVSLEIIKAIKINCLNNVNLDFPNVDYFLLDSGSGSGKTFDWNINLDFNKPLFIAGGINIKNIEEAYKIFKPYAFDLSSSVEVNGYKDFNKMKEISSKLEFLNGEYNE